MQSCIDGYFDKLNDIPDSWIEILNPNNHSVQLKGYRIGKTNSFIRAFILPEILIPAKGHYVVFCDKSDIIVDKEIHTDFRLNTDTEGDIYLFQPDQKIADHVNFPAMPAPNVAYGRLSDGNSLFGYELTPTLGTSNTGGHAKAVLPDPSFNTSSTVMTLAEDESVVRYTIFIPKNTPDGTVARYTTDGTEPTTKSPILSKPTYFRSNTIVKAALFADSCITPPSVSRVFLFHGRDIKLPVVSISTQDLYLNDPNIGILYNNTAASRVNWRRPATLDYFPKSTSGATISQRCEIRVAGAYTRQFPLKSLAVYANKRFGTNDYFVAQFWPTDKSGIFNSKSIILRNSGNDFLYSNFRDGAIQRSVGPYCDLDWQGFQPAIFYLNGQYRGIINIRERANEDNIWANYNGLKDIDQLELESKKFVVKEGTYNNYGDFENFYKTDGHSYQEFDSIMDVVQYTNHIITNTFFGNTDYPGNNCVLWRPQTDGGRWRWIMKDTDFGLNLYGFHPYNTSYLNWVLRTGNFEEKDANTPAATLLIRQLMKNNEYKQMFIDRFTVYMGDFLNSDNINLIINSIKTEIEYEYPYFKEAYPNYNNWNNWNNWNNHINDMLSWCENRTTYMWTDLRNFFELGSLIPCTVNTTIDYPEDYDVVINSVPLTQGMFRGNFFTNRSYTISADYYDSRYAVIGWEISSTVNKQTTKRISTGSVLTFTPASGTTNLSLNAIMGVNGIENTRSDRKEIIRTIYINTTGQQSETPFNGLNIIKSIYIDGSASSRKEYIK